MNKNKIKSIIKKLGWEKYDVIIKESKIGYHLVTDFVTLDIEELTILVKYNVSITTHFDGFARITINIKKRRKI